jgi:glutamate formiminotransferase
LPATRSGAIAVGARPVLVAYNVWLAPGTWLDTARAVAATVRGRAVRALGFDVGGRMQVSCNLIEPERFGPSALFDAVASRTAVDGAELVGLVPASVMARVPELRWSVLDLDPSRTIEARLLQAGLDGGSEGGAKSG